MRGAAWLSMTRKVQTVTGVVSCVVDRFRTREADDEHDRQTERYGGQGRPEHDKSRTDMGALSIRKYVISHRYLSRLLGH